MRNLNFNETVAVSGSINRCDSALVCILGDPVTATDLALAVGSGAIAYLSPYGQPADNPLLRATLGTLTAFPLITIFKGIL